MTNNLKIVQKRKVIKNTEYKKKKINSINNFMNKHSTEEINNSVTELMDEILKIKLPLSIIYYEITGEENKGTNINNCIEIKIRLESSEKWPTYKNLIKVVDTLIFIEIYKKLKYRFYVEEDLLLCFYKNIIFRIKIDHKEEENGLYNFIKNSNIEVKNGIKYIKYYLSFYGFYPNYITDSQIDILALRSLKKSGIEIFYKFLTLKNMFYHCDINTGEIKKYDNETMKENNERMEKIEKEIINNNNNFLNLLKNKSKADYTYKNILCNLKLNYNEYSFILSEKQKDGFLMVEKKNNKFLMGKFLQDFKMDKYGYFFYSEPNKMLMVKIFDNNLIHFILNVILCKTSFQFIKIINK